MAWLYLSSPPRCYLVSAGLLAVLTAISQSVSILADEAESHRTQFQHCPDIDAHPALDDIHPEQTRDTTQPHDRIVLISTTLLMSNVVPNQRFSRFATPLRIFMKPTGSRSNGRRQGLHT